MPKTRKQSFSDVSPEERSVVGNPEDYLWDEVVELPARSRPGTVQFSLRVDRDLYEQIQTLAKQQGLSFSDIVREAMGRYVRNGGRLAISNVEVTFRRDLGMLVQIAGGRAEPSNRRAADTSDRVPLGESATTS